MNIKIFIGLAIAFAIGFACRAFKVPVPCPNTIIGALLVVAMTAGFLLANHLLK